jgi:hypothetical protein
MPASPAKVNVIVVAENARDFQSSVPVIIGWDSTYATANSPVKYFDYASLSADHGAATLTSAAGKLAFKNGARSIVVIKPTVTSVAAESEAVAATGTVAHHPVTFTTVPTVSVDSVSKILDYVVDDPIAESPATGHVSFNLYTGKYKIGGSAPSTSVTFTYKYIDYTALENALLSQKYLLGPFTAFIFPSYPLGLGSFGDYNAFAGTAGLAANDGWFCIAHLASAETAANVTTLRTALQSQYIMAIAHKDTVDDVAAAFLGISSKTDPWNTLAFKRTRELTVGGYYLATEIGDVQTSGSLEGEGANPLHRLANQDVLTNERTLVDYATTATAEIYASRILTRLYLEKRMEADLNTLLVNSPKIGFDAKGIGSVTAVLTKILEELVSQNAINRDYTIVTPVLANISTADKQARSLGPFNVTCHMIESAHKITVNVSLQVA